MRIGDSTVTGNSTGLWNSNGKVASFGDNLVAANEQNTHGTITVIGKT